MNAQVQELHPASTKIAEYSKTAAALADLAARYSGVVYEVGTKDGMTAAKDARKELRSLRTALEDKRKELKAPALERSRLIDAEAKDITEKIVALEQPIAAQIEAEETRLEREKQARIDAEAKRVDTHRKRIEAIRGIPAQLTGRSAEVISKALETLKENRLGAEFEEFEREAQAEQTIAIATITGMLAGAQAQEAEAAKIAAERAELARLQKERAERDAKEEAERKARIEAEEKATKETRAREEAEARAERERLDREAAAEREKLRLAAEEHYEAVRAAHAASAGPDPSIGGGPADPTYAPRDESAPATRERIYFEALTALKDIVMPGSEEADIIEKAFAAAEAVK